MEAKKEAERSRKERMGTVPISEFSRHRALVADGYRGRGGGFLTVALGVQCVEGGGGGRRLIREKRRWGKMK